MAAAPARKSARKAARTPAGGGGLYNPTAATTALRKRAEAVAAGGFEAEIRHLFFLAAEWRKAAADDDAGLRRDMAREFGLQFRATVAAVRAAEDQLAAGLETTDWKAAMKSHIAGDRTTTTGDITA